MLCLLGMSLSHPGYGLASDDIHADVSVSVNDSPAQALHLSQHHQTRHLNKRSLTFALFVDDLRFQPQLITGLGAQLYSLG